MDSLDQKGFTLFELIIVLVLISVLFLLVAPLGNIVDQFEFKHINQKLYNSLYLTQSKAIKTQQHVSICGSKNGILCDTNNVWDSGWIVFLNKNNNQSLDINERLISVENHTKNKYKIHWNHSSILTFNHSGSPSNQGEFTVCKVGEINTDIGKITLLPNKRIIKSLSKGNCP